MAQEPRKIANYKLLSAKLLQAESGDFISAENAAHLKASLIDSYEGQGVSLVRVPESAVLAANAKLENWETAALENVIGKLNVKGESCYELPYLVSGAFRHQLTTLSDPQWTKKYRTDRSSGVSDLY